MNDLLPAEIYTDKIRDVISENQTVIICGETGSGKSTVIPQVGFSIFPLLDEIILIRANLDYFGQ